MARTGFSRQRRRRRRAQHRLTALGWGSILLVVAGLIAVPMALRSSRTDVTITVTSKERVGGREGSKYLVWTSDETFQDTDSLFNTKFDSSDLYGHLQVGSTYRCTVQGWRIPALSQYRNLIDCTA